jgi:hypothetical protein
MINFSNIQQIFVRTDKIFVRKHFFAKFGQNFRKESFSLRFF